MLKKSTKKEKQTNKREVKIVEYQDGNRRELDKAGKKKNQVMQWIKDSKKCNMKQK